ncbi:MAG TPA: type IV secretion system DNA-binding domain-containing protein [Pyrinomonadaceae bacterium]|nr:type IV secretion system DNA-binding domain-containing protein [Pyrinomonadaceae bacterium]
MEVYLGTKQTDGSDVTIHAGTRGKHMAIFGKSGVGKTTLMRNMFVVDLAAGNGLTVVDPHGSLIEDLLAHIPRHRRNDVIYLNPADSARVIGLNVLESVDPRQRSLIVSSVISIMRNLWPLNWGPRSEWILEHAVYALLEQPAPVTLAALPKLLIDHTYRKKIVSNVTDPAILSFFHFYESQNAKLREESIAPLLNKVSKFITNPLLRAVIGQERSSFDFRWAMDTGKILLCNLSKGALGEDVSSLLGSLIVTKLSLASLSRQNIPEADRRPHYLYADEVQNFVHGVNLTTILSESRKYALSLTIGTQTLTQLPEESLAAVFGNCASIISFRVSGEDAKALVREFGASGEGPRMTEQMFDIIIPASELQNLPDYKLYLRTLLDGKPQEPFLVDSFPPFPKSGKEIAADHVIQTSMERYGRDRKGVERALNRFLAAA